jgi:hypothetical protein
MKTRCLLLSLLAASTILIAGPLMPYDSTKAPSLSLPAGYELALAELGSATNHFYCTRANLVPHSWVFVFCTTNTPPDFNYVSVSFDGNAHILNGGAD